MNDPLLIPPLDQTNDKIQWQYNQSISHIQPNIQQYNPGLYSANTIIDDSTDVPSHESAVQHTHHTIQQRITNTNNIIQFNQHVNDRIDQYYQQQDVDATNRYNALPQQAKSYLSSLFDIHSAHNISNLDPQLTDVQLARMKLLSYALPNKLVGSYRNNNNKITDLLTNDEFVVYKTAVRTTELTLSRQQARQWKLQHQKTQLYDKQQSINNKQQQQHVFDDKYIDIVDNEIDEPRGTQPPQPYNQQSIDLMHCYTQLRKLNYIPCICSCHIDIMNITDYNYRHIHNIDCQYYTDIVLYIDILQQITTSLHNNQL